MNYAPACAVLAAAFATMFLNTTTMAAGIGGVSASASYQGASDGPNVQTHPDPGAANASASAGPGGPAFASPEGVQLFDEAIARARSSLVTSTKDSSIGAYSHAGGYSPGFAPPPDHVQAEAAVRLKIEFIVHAPAGVDTAQLTLELGFDGSLYAASFGGASNPGEVFAGVSARVDTISSLGTATWFDASARLDRFGGFTSSGPWSAAFTPVSANYTTLSYNEEFPGLITVPTNEVFTFDAQLNTGAFVHGPFENWAVADFFNTGTFDLSASTPGVTLERIPSVIPVPGAALLALAPLALLGRSRRDRGTHESRGCN